jgi:pyruvate/2-oxoglutarate dehydrogenase complex dihydrolipoamide acyltransferase (E2) component
MRSMMEARAVRRAGAQVAFGAAVMMFSSLVGSASAGTVQAPTTPQGQTQQPAPAQPAQPTDPAAQPAAPAAPAKPQLTFDNADAVVWFYAVKGDSGPKFEEFFTRVKEAMSKSTNPERKAQAAGMRLMKSTSPAGDGTLNYVLLISPISKGQEYSPGMLLFEVFPTEAKTLVDQLQSYINDKGLNAAVPLTNVMTLGGM